MLLQEDILCSEHKVDALPLRLRLVWHWRGRTGWQWRTTCSHTLQHSKYHQCRFGRICTRKSYLAWSYGKLPSRSTRGTGFFWMDACL